MQRLPDFLERRPPSFRLWLRRNALEQVVTARRPHLGVRKRSVDAEIGLSEAPSLALVRHFGSGSSSHAAQRKELADRIRQAMDALIPSIARPCCCDLSKN